MGVNNTTRQGFTLLELLVALTIMSVAMTVVVATFLVTLRGYQRGNELIDGLHHGDFVMEQLISTLRSMAYFKNAPGKYGFWLEDESNGPYPTDKISFVTSGSAFLPQGSHYHNGLHRLKIGIEENDNKEFAVTVTAFPHLFDPKEWEEEEPWQISAQVKGLDLRTYNMQEQEWEDEWENTNAIPSLVEVTLYMDPLEPGEDPISISRVVEIPLGPVVADAVDFQNPELTDTQGEQGRAESERQSETGKISPMPPGNGKRNMEGIPGGDKNSQ